MKKIIIIILCFVSFTASAQWTEQKGKHKIDSLYIGTTSNNTAGKVMLIKDTVVGSPTYGKTFHQSIPSAGTTDLAYTASPTNGIVTSSTGTDATIPLATNTNAGLMPPFTESTYTPTLTNTTNIAASTAYTTYYIRVGDWVHVWGTVDIDATTSLTISDMGMSLPISSAIGQIYDISGTASFEDNTSVQIKADVGNTRAVWRFNPQSATNNKYSFHFSYKYQAP